MPKSLSELEEHTQQWIGQIELLSVEEMVQYVDKREELIQQILNSDQIEINAEHFRDRIVNLLLNDHVILNKMQQLKEESLHNFNMAAMARKQKNRYEENFISDSIFFDQKK
ncbi:hypothetical protein [Paenibacillus gansuensis]|uniref:Flagellar protein FliT n=1 Tax=Paenibacillus gansuensis TaxID=306542 RepID=A0ABW5PJZ1_9BACL